MGNGDLRNPSKQTFIIFSTSAICPDCRSEHRKAPTGDSQRRGHCPCYFDREPGPLGAAGTQVELQHPHFAQALHCRQVLSWL